MVTDDLVENNKDPFCVVQLGRGEREMLSEGRLRLGLPTIVVGILDEWYIVYTKDWISQALGIYV